MHDHPLVNLESPFAGDIQKNLAYARACMSDCLHRGEYPIASHLLYTQEGILRDHDKEERALGMAAGRSWARLADKTVVYQDLGISPGMQLGADDFAKATGRPVEYRTLGGEWGLETPAMDWSRYRMEFRYAGSQACNEPYSKFVDTLYEHEGLELLNWEPVDLRDGDLRGKIHAYDAVATGDVGVRAVIERYDARSGLWIVIRVVEYTTECIRNTSGKIEILYGHLGGDKTEMIPFLQHLIEEQAKSHES